jgi:hypothetical protein
VDVKASVPPAGIRSRTRAEGPRNAGAGQ